MPKFLKRKKRLRKFKSSRTIHTSQRDINTLNHSTKFDPETFNKSQGFKDLKRQKSLAVDKEDRLNSRTSLGSFHFALPEGLTNQKMRLPKTISNMC